MKLTIKPFSPEIEEMSKIIYNFLKENISELQLNSADLSHPFNSCTVLLYHTLLDLKRNLVWVGIVTANTPLVESLKRTATVKHIILWLSFSALVKIGIYNGE